MGELELGAAAEATVQAYKELAVDPAKRLPLALDQTCVQFLAYVVAEGTGALVQVAVDTLQLLAESPECRPSLANTFGVLEALQEMADDARYREELRNQAASLFTCLQFSRHVRSNKGTPKASPDGQNSNVVESESIKENKETPPKLSSKLSIPSQDSVDTSSSISEKAGFSLITKSESKSSNEKSFLGPFNSKAKTVTLFIGGMTTQKHRQEIEEELVRIRGLISIVFDLSKSRVTCRVKRDLSVDKLAAAVSQTEHYSAQQVIVGPDGEEEESGKSAGTAGLFKTGTVPVKPENMLVVKIGTTRPNVISPIEDLPDYLPEEETPVKDTASAVAQSSSFKEAASSFISAAANLLQNSFYW